MSGKDPKHGHQLLLGFCRKEMVTQWLTRLGLLLPLRRFFLADRAGSSGSPSSWRLPPGCCEAGWRSRSFHFEIALKRTQKSGRAIGWSEDGVNSALEIWLTATGPDRSTSCMNDDVSNFETGFSCLF